MCLSATWWRSVTSSGAVESRSNDLDRDHTAGDHGSDLRVWVELRGFEPLTPLDANEREAVREIPRIIDDSRLTCGYATRWFVAVRHSSRRTVHGGSQSASQTILVRVGIGTSRRHVERVFLLTTTSPGL
jgi:hypothetical protein